jgi:hypothetical protein
MRGKGKILDSLPPDVRAATDEDVRRVQEEARSLVKASALARTRETALSARSVSEFVRVNRVEGLALGTGIGRRFGGGVFARLSGRYGFSDNEAKGDFVLGWQKATTAASSSACFAHSGTPGTSRNRRSCATASRRRRWAATTRSPTTPGVSS